MARIKWEDRKYNIYFTMKGIGKRPKTRPDKDLRKRLGVLQFRYYWKQLESYRKQLIARLGSGLGRGRGSGRPDPDDFELREEAILTELRLILGNLKGNVSFNSPGGIKHLLKMIEEIIRLISRVFHPSFQSLAPCFAAANISAGSYPRGPPEGRFFTFCHCERNGVERSNPTGEEKGDCFGLRPRNDSQEAYSPAKQDSGHRSQLTVHHPPQAPDYSVFKGGKRALALGLGGLIGLNWCSCYDSKSRRCCWRLYRQQGYWR